jgi:hypothetical protein
MDELRYLSDYFTEHDLELIRIDESNKNELLALTKKDGVKLLSLCGTQIYGTLHGILESYVDEPDEEFIIYVLKSNASGKIVALFQGEISGDDSIESSYTCSKTSVPSCGAYLRYYALLEQHQINPNIATLFGYISGGIPALSSSDSADTARKKQQKLKDYHEKRGAIIKGTKFIYTLHAIISKIKKDSGKGLRKKKKHEKRTRRKTSKSKTQKRSRRK